MFFRVLFREILCDLIIGMLVKLHICILFLLQEVEIELILPMCMMWQAKRWAFGISTPLFFSFLALLVFTQQSYCHGAGVRRPSVVRKVKFFGNRCMDPGQILWVAPSPPYLQPYFFFFSKFSIFKFLQFFFSFSLTWDPMGAKISKRYSSIFHPI